MKRAALWILGAGIAGVGLMLALRAQERQAGTPSPTPASSATPSEDKVAFTFPDDEQLKQFAQLWQARQGVLTRMAVLQDYWTLEQNGLGEANKQLLEKYQLDVNKNYTLDTDRKVLLERPAPPDQPSAQLGQAQPQTQPAATANP